MAVDPPPCFRVGRRSSVTGCWAYALLREIWCSVPLEALERALPKQPFRRDVRYSTSAVNDGSTQTALGFFIGLVSLDFADHRIEMFLYLA
jgi:hypothetical protein